MVLDAALGIVSDIDSLRSGEDKGWRRSLLGVEEALDNQALHVDSCDASGFSILDSKAEVWWKVRW